MYSDQSPFRILVVDDDEDDFFITNEYIKNIKGYNFLVEWKYDYKSALSEICEKKHDLYLVDYYLGAKTGLDLIKEAINNKCDEPMIILTGKGTPEIDAEAMHSGAVDFLIKGEMNTEKLDRCIRHVIEKSKGIRTLRSNERKFRHIFERSKDAVFLIDTDFHFLDANEATYQLFSFSTEELKEITLTSLFTNPSDEMWLQGQLLTGEIEDKEIEMKTGEDESIHCILSLSKEKDNFGRNFLQGIIHDISNIKKAEKTNLRLEKMGMAERLVRTLAHEVRNPLNNINLSLEQLSTEVQGEDAQMYLEIITRNSRRIEMLIKQLLGASRPEIDLKHGNLVQILEESIVAAEDRMLLRHITLTKEIPQVKAPIYADDEQLKIAFLNIIINAVEAMQDYGTLEIVLTIENDKYTVTISDTGCGISEENLARLFEPYFTAKKNGLGLGLAATMTILQSHGALAEVKSKIGEGTIFVISLPVKKEPIENLKMTV
jgi:PAS domain S-box-containing protein